MFNFIVEYSQEEIEILIHHYVDMVIVVPAAAADIDIADVVYTYHRMNSS
jgi:hypothetical protein